MKKEKVKTKVNTVVKGDKEETFSVNPKRDYLINHNQYFIQLIEGKINNDVPLLFKQTLKSEKVI